jgi:CheY-like chemotaxis protein
LKHVDLIITDQHDELANVDPSDIFDCQHILVVHSYIASLQNTRQYWLQVGGIRAPIGPFKLARSILAVLEQGVSPAVLTPSNKSNRGKSTPFLPIEHLSTYGNRFTDFGLTTQPPKISLNPNESSSNDDSVQNLILTPKAHNDVCNQGFASLRTIYPQTSSQVTSQTPTEVAQSSSLEQNSPSVPLDSTSGLHILAVDDNMLNLRLIQRYLLKRKFEFVSTAHNGLEAVASVREAANKGTHFDIIFMDISMPEMDGFEATRIIRSFERSFAHLSRSEDIGVVDTLIEEDNLTEERSEKKEQGGSVKNEAHRAYVVALTGLASRRDRDEAEASGFDDFLTKPISFEKIGSLLQQLSIAKIVKK